MSLKKNVSEWSGCQSLLWASVPGPCGNRGVVNQHDESESRTWTIRAIAFSWPSTSNLTYLPALLPFAASMEIPKVAIQCESKNSRPAASCDSGFVRGEERFSRGVKQADRGKFDDHPHPTLQVGMSIICIASLICKELMWAEQHIVSILRWEHSLLHSRETYPPFRALRVGCCLCRRRIESRTSEFQID